MTFSDEKCCECTGAIATGRRVYKTPEGLPRCAVCQVLATLRLEIVKITTLVELMNDIERARLH